MLPDLLRPGLKLVFCGYNPSLMSARTGHRYAHPANRFWRVLFAAGITNRLYTPEEDEQLLDLGIGFTDLVPRPTRSAADLRPDEIRAGADALLAKIERFQPRIVAYTGTGVYGWFRRSTKVAWGVQEIGAVPGVIDVVVPSPSGLNRMNITQLVEHYRALVPLLK